MLLLGICGSLREQSFNRKLLQHTATLLHDSIEFKLADWSGIPVYNQDNDTDQKPVSVVTFKQAIASADGLLIATPEYNYGIPGALKNAIDWASRPAYKSVFAGKPTGVLSASMGPTGGNRAQGQLRQILAGMLTPVYSAPEFILPAAHNAFDDKDQLTDNKAIQSLQRYLDGYIDWLSSFDSAD